MSCLTRAFPFLISDWVPEGDRHMDLVLNLLPIMELIFSPKISKGMLGSLETHHLIFKELFPKVTVINKQHHLDHYPKMISDVGPATLYWCMRFEGKNNTLSCHGAVMCNFKNACKTLARLCQLFNASFGVPVIHR